MDLPPYLLHRFETAKEDFKTTVCRQVDALFGCFLEELKTAGLGPGSGESSLGSSESACPAIFQSFMATPEVEEINPFLLPPTLLPQLNQVQPPLFSPVPDSLSDQKVKKEVEDVEIIDLIEPDQRESTKPDCVIMKSDQDINPKIYTLSDSDCDCSDCCDHNDDDEDYLRPSIKTENPNDDERPKDPKQPKLSQYHYTSSSTQSRNQTIFHCPINGCSQQFKRRHDLKVHHRDVHFSEEPQFICRFCGKCYPKQYNLSRHEFLHKGVRPYRCKWTECNVSTAERSHLVRHIRKLHFNLPRTLIEQRKAGIIDDRDPTDYIEINEQLLNKITD